MQLHLDESIIFMNELFVLRWHSYWEEFWQHQCDQYCLTFRFQWQIRCIVMLINSDLFFYGTLLLCCRWETWFEYSLCVGSWVMRCLCQCLRVAILRLSHCLSITLGYIFYICQLWLLVMKSTHLYCHQDIRFLYGLHSRQVMNGGIGYGCCSLLNGSG
jgi:hypothetical protein